MANQVFQILYSSEAVKDLNSDELTSLLKKARIYNKEKDITGALMYAEVQFLQLLEGPEENIKLLYKKIEKDPRHKGLILHYSSFKDNRLFSKWNMAFRRTSDYPVKIREMIKETLVDKDSKIREKNILKLFQEILSSF